MKLKVSLNVELLSAAKAPAPAPPTAPTPDPGFLEARRAGAVAPEEEGTLRATADVGRERGGALKEPAGRSEGG